MRPPFATEAALPQEAWNKEGRAILIAILRDPQAPAELRRAIAMALVRVTMLEGCLNGALGAIEEYSERTFAPELSTPGEFEADVQRLLALALEKAKAPA